MQLFLNKNGAVDTVKNNHHFMGIGEGVRKKFNLKNKQLVAVDSIKQLFCPPLCFQKCVEIDFLLHKQAASTIFDKYYTVHTNFFSPD